MADGMALKPTWRSTRPDQSIGVACLEDLQKLPVKV
jgi:hypothetical protein